MRTADFSTPLLHNASAVSLQRNQANRQSIYDKPSDDCLQPVEQSPIAKLCDLNWIINWSFI
ncbi:hypothetical protein [Nocardia sp. NPDC004750]